MNPALLAFALRAIEGLFKRRRARKRKEKEMEWLWRIIVPLISRRESAFWGVTVNAVVQLVLRGLSWLAPENDFTQFGESLANALLYVFPAAALRVVSKVIKPGAPATMAEAEASAVAPGGSGGVTGGQGHTSHPVGEGAGAAGYKAGKAPA